MVAKVKHTSGPWHISGRNRTVVLSSDLIQVAHATYRNGVDDETRANAQLIASVTDLLDALDDILMDADNADGRVTWASINKARRAVAKATTAGESC